MRQFFAAFAQFYPCTWCARDFQENLAQYPARCVCFLLLLLCASCVVCFCCVVGLTGWRMFYRVGTMTLIICTFLFWYRTSSRQELCQWVCRQHNLVNEKLGKPLFSCDMKDLDERWRTSTNEECRKSGGHWCREVSPSTNKTTLKLFIEESNTVCYFCYFFVSAW